MAGVIGFVAVALAAAPAAADPARPGNVASHVTAITPATPAIGADIVGGSAFLRRRSPRAGPGSPAPAWACCSGPDAG